MVEAPASTPAKAAKTSRLNKASPSAFEHVAFQLIDESSPSTREETEANSAAADAIEEASPYGVIIEDGLPVGDGQINRTVFMDDLAPAIERAADELLRPEGRTARDCPYLTFWVDYYRKQSAAHLERAIARYVRPGPRDLEGIRQAILDHVGKAVQAWIDRRELQVPGPIDGLGGDRVPDFSSDGAVAQRMGADGTGSPSAPGSATAICSQLNGGRPLESTVRSRMERGFGTSFDDVRIHTGSEAASTAQAYTARAFTLGRDVAFGADEYRPGTPVGDALIAHELAHVLQQRGAATEDAPASTETNAGSLENDADTSARDVMARLWAGVGTLDRTPLPARRSGLKLQRCKSKSDKEDAGIKDAGVARDAAIEDAKGLGYNAILNAAGPGSKDAVLLLKTLEKPDGDVDVAKFHTFTSPDALKVLALERHAAGTACEKWFPKLRAGAITLTDPYASPAGKPPVVRAFYFPGKTDRRALILGGVHNKTEPQGERVVEKLRMILAARPSPPFFTTILVPSLFDKARYDEKKGRWVTGGTGYSEKGKLESDKPVEPNRNFPLPGEGLEEAHKRGVAGGPELVFRDPAKPGEPPRASKGEEASSMMLPENRALLALIETFHPERIASVHAHSLQDKDPKTGEKREAPIGNAPGIFVDPRGGFDRATDKPKTAQGVEDDRLATAMVAAGVKQLKATPIKNPRSDPFSGNRPTPAPTSVHYADSAVHAEGYSLGDWAPVPVTIGSGKREGITTITIEVPQWDKSSPQIDQIEALDAKLLNEIFLEDPAAVTKTP